MKNRVAIRERHRQLLHACVTLLAVFVRCECVESHGEEPTEWPQYRGHQASGVSDHSATPAHWDVETGKNVLWQTEIPGLGHSAPIVWRERIYVTTAQAETKPKLDISRSGAEDAAGDLCSRSQQNSHHVRGSM